MMTISTQCFQVFLVIVFPIAIFMMNNQVFQRFLFALFASNFSYSFNSCRKTFCNIIKICRTRPKNSRTFFRTKLSEFSIHFVPSSNSCSADFAWISFDTLKRTIISLFAKSVCLKQLVTSFASTGFFHRFVPTFFGTIKLLNAFASVMAFELRTTNKAFVHRSYYAIA